MLSTTADVVLPLSERDKDIRQMPLDHRIPAQPHSEQVVDYLEAQADWAGLREIVEHVNIPSARIAGLLILDVESAGKKERSKYRHLSRHILTLQSSPVDKQ
ncbi:hypothetical protein [Mycobacterium sp. TY815]|uniref:hypothetical protein n=1 Tax=Mycobacterium sp. TY815 TaxID=3050581 RepID=UPI002740AC6A|nr:hypothetical protein [Mycobacterium sp. TY815]MDP7701318.1 hypothetical protein [Mycobacterium sp. TY815]